MITIIIPHWNTPERLKKQLTTLGKRSHFQIIVIDNASRERLTWVKETFPYVKLIQNKYNRGYAFACNQGVVQARGEWCLFLNPDVKIHPDHIEAMVQQAEDRQVDAGSPKSTSAYQKPLPSSLTLVAEFTLLHKLIPLSVFTKKTLFGGCLLIRTAVIKELGGWDERFFLWFEDSDLTQRLYDAHYSLTWFDIPIKHTGGDSFEKMSSQQKKDIFFHSMDIYAKKHFSFYGQWVVHMIKRRYTQRNILPEEFVGISITVPNLKKDLLTTFFTKNKFLEEIEELIIVTSGIQPENIWEWRRKYPLARFIVIERNAGFAATVNIGLRAATGAWRGTVNDDVIMPKDWLKQCLACQSEDIGSLNPIIMTTEGKVESAGIDILWKGKALPRTTIEEAACYEVDATNAAAVLYTTNALNTVGLFDERFGSYLEDIDLSLRLKNNGFKNVVVAKAMVVHSGHTTAKTALGGRKAWYDFRNWIYVIIKNWGVRRSLVHSPEIIVERLRNISGMIKPMA